MARRQLWAPEPSGMKRRLKLFAALAVMATAVVLAALATGASIDLGYGPNLFYYLRHDSTGFSTFGTVSTSGAVLARFGAGLNLNPFTLTSCVLRYSPNLFYYLRHDPATGLS